MRGIPQKTSSQANHLATLGFLIEMGYYMGILGPITRCLRYGMGQPLPAPRSLIEVRKSVCGRHRPNRELQGAGNFHTMRVTKTCLGSLLSAKGVNLRSSPLDRRSSCIGHSVNDTTPLLGTRSGRSVSCLHKASPGLCADLWQSASLKESLMALTRINSLASGFSAIERTVGEAQALRVKMQPDHRPSPDPGRPCAS